MKQIHAIVVAAVAGALVLPAKAEDFGDAYEKSLGSVVYITAFDQRWEISHGTGVLIAGQGGDVLILTAYHVVGPDRLVSAHFPAYDKDGQLITNAAEYDHVTDNTLCEVIARNPKLDLALLKFKHPGAGLKPIPLAGKSARPGQAVFTIGNDAGASMWHFASGNTRQVHHAEQTFPSGQQISAVIIEMTTPLNGGDSGGPLLNDAGELVGINSSFTQGANAVSSGIDLAEVRVFLKEAEQATAVEEAAPK